MNTDKLEELIAAGDLNGLNTLLQGNPALAKAPTSHGVSPLMLSCYFKKPEVSNLLLKFVDEVNLFEASAVGKFDVVAYIVGTHPDSVNDYAADGFTPLGLACYFGQAEVARYLVLKGADVNLPSNNGFHVHPLHSAVAGNYTDIARMLVNNGGRGKCKATGWLYALAFGSAKWQYRDLDTIIRTWRRSEYPYGRRQTTRRPGKRKRI
jgi:ankyrin repeat protein